jgi:hypothetical protein
LPLTALARLLRWRVGNESNWHLPKAIQRTFAKLYSVPADSVDVMWDREGITVRCAGLILTHQTGNDDNEFVSEGEDPVTVTLTDDDRYHLERRV